MANKPDKRDHFWLVWGSFLVAGGASITSQLYAGNILSSFPLLAISSKAFGTGAMYYVVVSFIKKRKLAKHKHIGWFYKYVVMCSMIVGIVAMLGITQLEISKLQNVKSKACMEIGRDRDKIAEYIQRIEGWFNKYETFDPKESRALEKEVDDWLSKTGKWIKENMPAGAYADFYFNVVDDDPRGLSPEGRLESKLRKYSLGLIMVDNNYCKGK